MAEFIADIGFAVDSKGIDDSVKSLSKLKAANDDVTKKSKVNNSLVKKSYDDTNKSVGGLTSSLRSMRTLIGTLGIAALVASASKFVNLAGQYRTFNATIKANVNSAEEFVKVNEALLKVAKDSRQPLGNVLSLYQGIAPALREAGYEQAEVVRTAELASKAMKLAGGSAQGHAAAMTQLTQALGSGVLRGEEFNSIMENGPGLARALADGLGVPVGALRAMAAEGELTTVRVVAALNAQGDAVDAAFNKLPVKASEAWTLVGNSIILAIGRIDAVIGVSDTVTKGIIGLSKFIESFGNNVALYIGVAVTAYNNFIDAIGQATDGPLLWLRGFINLIKEVGKFLAPVLPFIGKLVAVLGALVLLKAGIAGAAAALTLVSKALVAIKVAALANPVILMVAALAAAALTIMRNWDRIEGYFSTLWNRVSIIFMDFKTWVTSIFSTGLTDGLKNIATAIGSKMIEIAVGAIDTVKTVFTNPKALLDSIKNTGESMVDTLIQPFKSNAVPDASDEWAAKVQGSVIDLANGVDKETLRINNSYNSIIRNLGLQYAAIEKGESAVRAMELSYEGLTDEMIDNITAQEAEIKLLTVRKQQMDAVDQELRKLNDDLIIHNAEMTGGASAAREAELALAGYTKEQIASATAIENSMRFQSEFKNALVDSITNADTIKEAFSNMGDWLKNWLKEQIAHFAANKIMAFLGMGDAGGIGSLLGGLGNMGSLVTGGLASIVSGLGGGAASAGAASGYGMAGAGTATGAGAMGMAGSAGMVAALAVATHELGSLFGELTGGNDKYSGIGALVGGPLGMVAGAALGTGWRDVAKGVEVAISKGNLTGNNFTLAERERSMWRGTEQSYQTSELDTGFLNTASSYFDSLKNNIQTQLRALGSQIDASVVMAGVNLESIKLSGEKAEEEFSAWLGEASTQAYMGMFETLNKQTRAYIEEFTGAAEDADPQAIIDAMHRVAISMASVSDVTDLLNLKYEATSPLAAAAADNLVLLMGGVDNLVKSSSAYYEAFFSDEEKKQRQLASAAAIMQTFNEGLAQSGKEAINSREQLREYVEGLDTMSVSGQEAYAQAMNVASALDALVTAETTAQQVIDSMPDALKNSFDRMKVNAQEAYDAIINKSAELNGATNNVTGSLSGLAQAQRTLAQDTAIATQRAARFAAAMRDIGNIRLPSTATINGSHRSGIKSIPHDGYIAELHKNERVLTANEASNLDRTNAVTSVTNNSNAANESNARTNSVLEKINSTLQAIRQENKDATKSNINGLASIDKASREQIETLRKVEEATEGTYRRFNRTTL